MKHSVYDVMHDLKTSHTPCRMPLGCARDSGSLQCGTMRSRPWKSLCSCRLHVHIRMIQTLCRWIQKLHIWSEQRYVLLRQKHHHWLEIVNVRVLWKETGESRTAGIISNLWQIEIASMRYTTPSTTKTYHGHPFDGESWGKGQKIEWPAMSRAVLIHSPARFLGHDKIPPMRYHVVISGIPHHGELHCFEKPKGFISVLCPLVLDGGTAPYRENLSVDYQNFQCTVHSNGTYQTPQHDRVLRVPTYIQ